MWNENAPLELLKELPSVLNDANLSRIQEVIDRDKFVNSMESGYDLCGVYAPFCKGCDKSVQHPCAVAYVRMKQAEGYKVEMQNVPAVEVEKKEEVKQVKKSAPKAEASTETKKKTVRVATAKRKKTTDK